MLHLGQLNFRYTGVQQQCLCDISLELDEGQFILLCGCSGCGKTTLTRCINGLIPRFFEGKFSGNIQLGQQSCHTLDIHHIAQKVASVFQDPRSQFFTTDVSSELAFGPENYGIPKEEIKHRIDEISELLDIGHLLGRSLFSLSSGEKQKVAIASSLIMRPSIVILDEPSANLDPEAIEELQQVLAILKQQNYTVIISEHRFFFLKDLVHRVLYFKDGKIQEEFSREMFYEFSDPQAEQYGLRYPNFKASLPSVPPNIGESSAQNQSLKNDDNPTMSPALQLENLCYSYNKNTVFKGFSLVCNFGEIIALTGNNGVGKTTLLRIVAGLAKANAGTMIKMKGQQQTPKQRKSHCTFVMQDADYQLFTESVFQELYLGNEKQKGIKEKVEQALKYFGLWELRNRHPSSLSGGEKQRLVIALSMVNNTDLILMDEPTSGLDRVNMERVATLLQELAALNKTIIVATHDYEFIEKCCSRTISLPVLNRSPAS